MFLFYNHNNDSPPLIASSYLPEQTSAKKISEEEIKQIAEKEINESQFTLNIYPKAIFESGDSTGNIYIRNVAENIYPISVNIVEDSTGDLLYESGAIEPGYEITTGVLNKNLSKGEYICTAEVSIFDPTTKEYRGQTAAEMEIIVNN